MAEIIHLDPVAAVFGQSGALARAFPGYAPRDGQVVMARLVHETAREGGGCLADAPCGTGKSLANREDRPDLRAFQRWTLTGLYRAVPWPEYRPSKKLASLIPADRHAESITSWCRAVGRLRLLEAA